MMEKKDWIGQLEQVERLARGSLWRRLQYAPARYLFGQLFQKVLYPRRRYGLPVRAHTFWGRKMQIVLPAAMDIFLLGAKTHDSEIRLARLLVDRLRPGDRVADIGAHYGFFSLLAAELVGPGGRVAAFEAAGATYEVLRKNAADLPNLQTHHLAVSDQSGDLAFYEFPTRYAEYNTSYPEQFRGQPWFERYPPQMQTVPAVSFDDFCRENQFQPALVKIDVEGAEEKVVAGMERLLTSVRPVVVMEYLAEERLNAAHRRAVQSLRTRRYLPYRISAQGRLQPCLDIEGELRVSGQDSDNLVFLPE